MPTNLPPIRTRAENREHVFSRFVGRLLGEHPGSVLDVGCGSGDLLARCAAAGVEAVGLEGESARVDGLRQLGLDAQVGRAESLPFEARSFEWVSLRHVPHHLDDPGLAVAEALRVARVGVLLAEPWYDRDLPSQAVGHAIDQWTRADDRRRGMVHGLGFGPAELADLVAAAGTGAVVELETHLRPSVEELGPLTADIERRLEAGAGGAAEVRALLARAAEVGAGLGGTALALARLA